MKELQVKCLDDLDIVMRVIRDQFDKHGSCYVSVKKLDESHRTAQFGQYWRWISPIAEYHGYTKLEMHNQFKEEFLITIYFRDITNHPYLTETVSAMKVIRGLAPDSYPALKKSVLRGIHLRDATKKNMMDYLTEVQNHARQYQIRLPAPERMGLLR